MSSRGPGEGGCRRRDAHRDGLAKGSLDRVARRDPEKVYHKMTEQELAALGPAFQWNAYFRDTGAPEFTSINVAWPDFVKAVNAEIQSAGARRLEDLSALASAALRGAAAARGVRERELQFLRQDADRREGIAAALEALRRFHRSASWARRSARSSSSGPSAPKASSAR